jgi:hypothetical protein
MPIDKQIFDLPEGTATFLQSQLAIGAQISTIVQVEGYDLDFQIDLSELLRLINQNSTSTLYSGSKVPDNALGRNGDIYKQSNGKIYLKAGDAWQILNNVPQPFQELKRFTYDGTNNVVPLSFAPNTGGIAILNTLPLVPFDDYSFDGKNMSINKNQLTNGIEYTLNLLYFK